MELELKHFSGYFPHGLDCVIKNKIVRLTSLNRFSCETRPSVHGFTWCAFKDIKLILQPLSDVTRKELEEQGFDSHIDYLTYENQGVEWTLEAPFNMVQYLLSQHYDIYGLIPAGLAIDRNTL